MPQTLRYYVIAFTLFFGLQFAFWNTSHHRLPDMTVVPTPPGKDALDVLSFGDKETVFRLMGFLMGNAGDTFGRFTPLYQYDMKKIYTWFTLLDHYNHQSQLLPTLAAYYYSQTQKTSDIQYITDYLYEHSRRDIKHKWWWLMQGIYLANHKLEDSDLALKMALPLTTSKEIPIWAQQLPAIVYEKRGEFEDAFAIMNNILASYKAEEIPEKDMRYMRYFLDERLEKWEEVNPKYKQHMQFKEFGD